MRKFFLLIGAALVLLTGGLTATTASAASGVFSVWDVRDGSRCDFPGNAPSLGHCANHDYLIANNGNPCSGCDWVRLYWGSNYSGAYICLAPGDTYGQPTTPGLSFTKGGLSAAGYGQSVWNNAASAKWSGPC